MKKEIMELVASKNGKFRLNNICYLERWQEGLLSRRLTSDLRAGYRNDTYIG